MCSGFILGSQFFVLENYFAVFFRDRLNYLHIAGDNNKMVELPAQRPQIKASGRTANIFTELYPS